MKRSWRSKPVGPGLTVAFPLLVGSFLAVRLFVFIDRHAVNLLFWDQWDFWEGMFRGQSLWSLFRWQHGPHRQGLGYLVIAACARLSAWDSRAESFVIGALIVLSAVLALTLTRRLRGSWSPFDLAIPLIFLTLSQYEIMIGTLNPAHGVVPLLCVLAFAWALQVERPAARLPALVVLGVLGAYTGFGFFLGLVAPVVLALLLIAAIRKREAVVLHIVCLALSIGGFASFFWGYRLDTGTGKALPAMGRIPDYLRYLVVLFAHPFELSGSDPVTAALGIALVIGAIALVAWSGWRSLHAARSSPLHLTLFALSAFSLLFAINASIGRTELGAGQARAPRYVPYMMPILLAGYLALSLSRLRPRWRTCLLLAVSVGLVAKEVAAPINEAVAIQRLSEGKRRWKACFLEEGDVARCEQVSHFKVYPTAAPILWKLDYLREHHLNLFKP